MAEFTEEDVQLVAEALFADDTTHGLVVDSPTRIHFREARAVLAALAEAGRLLPPGSTWDEEWAMTYKLNGQQQEAESGGHVFDSREDAARHIAAWRKHYPDLTYADEEYLRRDVIHTPWEASDVQG